MSPGGRKVQRLSTELAEEILLKLNSKGWNLYKAVFTEDAEISPEETILQGPAQELSEAQMYIFLPKTDKPQNPESVTSKLEMITDKIKGKPLLPIGDTAVELLAMTLKKTEVEIPLEKKPTGQYKTVNVPIRGFIESLDYFLDTQKPSQINYANIDQPIRKMVYKLNQTGFLRTIKSRSAAIKQVLQEPKLFLEGRRPDIQASEDNIFITSGYVEFRITDIFDPKAQNFMRETRAVCEKYSFVTITHEETIRVECDCSDITKTDEIKPDDDTESGIRKRYEAKAGKAFKRIKEFCEFRDALVEIAEKYINPQPGMTKE
jgi:hypothetical protein